MSKPIIPACTVADSPARSADGTIERHDDEWVAVTHCGVVIAGPG